MLTRRVDVCIAIVRNQRCALPTKAGPERRVEVFRLDVVAIRVQRCRTGAGAALLRRQKKPRIERGPVG